MYDSKLNLISLKLGKELAESYQVRNVQSICPKPYEIPTQDAYARAHTQKHVHSQPTCSVLSHVWEGILEVRQI